MTRSSQSERRPPDFADFAEPFCAGWNAHRREGEIGPEAFARVIMEAYQRSGVVLAHKVNTGEMTEAAARRVLGGSGV